MAFPSKERRQRPTKGKMDERKEQEQFLILFLFSFCAFLTHSKITNLKWSGSKSAAMVAVFRMGWLECSIGASTSLLLQAL